MDIKEYIEQEQKHVNTYIQEEVSTLHSNIRGIAEHILSTGGKRLRPILLTLCARHFGYQDKTIYSLAIAVELIHSATLLHDDVLDNSELRRGVITAHTEFGIRNAILAGDALLAKGCHLVASRGIPLLLSKVSEIIMDTVEGEIEEIHCEGAIIRFEEYENIIRGKTARMIEKSCEMGAIQAGASNQDVAKIGLFGENLGMAFQIVDDILDYTGTNSFGKPKGIDIKEGKITAPLLFYVETLDARESKRILEGIIHKQYSATEVDSIIDNISRSCAIDKSYRLVQQYIDVALSTLHTLERTEEAVLLEQITLHSMKRKQ